MVRMAPPSYLLSIAVTKNQYVEPEKCGSLCLYSPIRNTCRVSIRQTTSIIRRPDLFSLDESFPISTVHPQLVA